MSKQNNNPDTVDTEAVEANDQENAQKKEDNAVYWSPLGDGTINCEHEGCKNKALACCDQIISLFGKQLFRGCDKKVCMAHVNINNS